MSHKKIKSEEIKNLGDRCFHVFAHIAYQVAPTESVRDAMALRVYILDLLSRTQVKLCAQFDLTYMQAPQ